MGAAASGYLFIPRDDPAFAGEHSAGQILRIEGRGPPWLVVDHTLDGVILASWPGQLWSVKIMDAITDREQKKLGSTLRDNAGYTRAAAVKLIEELPRGTLFGAHGESVCDVLEVALALSPDTAAKLAKARTADVARAYGRAWKEWLQQNNTAAAPGDDFSATLAFQSGKLTSPVGRALLAIDAVMGKRARAHLGDAAFIPDPDDPEGAFLAEPWRSACLALCDAALAFGAPGVVSEPDRDLLARAWRQSFGADPA